MEFYDPNLGTPEIYDTLDALIDTSLSPYFLLSNDKGMLGTPYAISVIHKASHQDNLETPGEH